jgi:hypothetical protein
MPEAT